MLSFTEHLGLYTIYKCNPSEAYNSRYMPTLQRKTSKYKVHRYSNKFN